MDICDTFFNFQDFTEQDFAEMQACFHYILEHNALREDDEDCETFGVVYYHNVVIEANLLYYEDSPSCSYMQFSASFFRMYEDMDDSILEYAPDDNLVEFLPNEVLSMNYAAFCDAVRKAYSKIFQKWAQSEDYQLRDAGLGRLPLYHVTSNNPLLSEALDEHFCIYAVWDSIFDSDWALHVLLITPDAVEKTTFFCMDAMVKILLQKFSDMTADITQQVADIPVISLLGRKPDAPRVLVMPYRGCEDTLKRFGGLEGFKAKDGKAVLKAYEQNIYTL